MVFPPYTSFSPYTLCEDSFFLSPLARHEAKEKKLFFLYVQQLPIP